MARLSLASSDGTEKAYELSSEEPFRIGRDPGNHAVIRDSKVSRTHAEIRYERGFFVLHDLSSANGTFVNGKRIRIAPLIDGARIRLGNSVATFSAAAAEPPTSPDLIVRPGHTAAYVPIPPSMNQTLPQPKISTAEFPFAVPDPEPVTEDLQDEIEAEKERKHTDPGLDDARFEIASETHSGSSGTVLNTLQQPLFYYYAPGKLVSFVAGTVAALVTIAGIASTIFLVVGSRPAGALSAMILTAAFTAVILLLIPPRHLFLFRDREMKEIALTIRQDSRFAFPQLRFSAAEADGELVGSLQKSTLSNLGRHRWWIFNHDRTAPVGYAIEDSLLFAWVRKFLGNFSPLFQTNFRIYSGEDPAGWIYRTNGRDRQVLDLSEDVSGRLDRRMGLALAIVISAVES